MPNDEADKSPTEKVSADLAVKVASMQEIDQQQFELLAKEAAERVHANGWVLTKSSSAN